MPPLRSLQSSNATDVPKLWDWGKIWDLTADFKASAKCMYKMRPEAFHSHFSSGTENCRRQKAKETQTQCLPLNRSPYSLRYSKHTWTKLWHDLVSWVCLSWSTVSNIPPLAHPSLNYSIVIQLPLNYNYHGNLIKHLHFWMYVINTESKNLHFQPSAFSKDQEHNGLNRISILIFSH